MTTKEMIEKKLREESVAGIMGITLGIMAASVAKWTWIIWTAAYATRWLILEIK